MSLWRPERTFLCNDGYAPLLADKHPRALGRVFMDVWTEAREPLTPLFDAVFAGEAGETVLVVDGEPSVRMLIADVLE